MILEIRTSGIPLSNVATTFGVIQFIAVLFEYQIGYFYQNASFPKLVTCGGKYNVN
jgi:hypothetical protein